MKILLISVGTRGDMEPFLAIGEILQEKGHRVICAFPEQFRDLLDGSSMDFYSLGTKFIEMMESRDGKAALGGGGSGLRKYITFGSMSNPEPDKKKKILTEILERNIIPAQAGVNLQFAGNDPVFIRF